MCAAAATPHPGAAGQRSGLAGGPAAGATAAGGGEGAGRAQGPAGEGRLLLAVPDEVGPPRPRPTAPGTNQQRQRS